MKTWGLFTRRANLWENIARLKKTLILNFVVQQIWQSICPVCVQQAFNNIVVDLDLSRQEDFYFGAKLVRGAYMEQVRLSWLNVHIVLRRYKKFYTCVDVCMKNYNDKNPLRTSEKKSKPYLCLFTVYKYSEHLQLLGSCAVGQQFRKQIQIMKTWIIF